MSTPAFDRFQTLMARKRRAWATFTARQRKLGAVLDPRTGGHAGMIHNWGNDAARAALRRGWARWHAYAAAIEPAIDAAMREHCRPPA